MRLCRFDDDRLGLVEGGDVLDVSAALDALPKVSWPYPPGDALIANLDRVRKRIGEIRHAAGRRPVSEVRLKSPVANPSKLIGAPVNYQAHVDEAKTHGQAFANPTANMLNIRTAGPFLKANSSLVGPGEGVALRFTDRRNDHEVELAVIVGKAGSNIPAARALEHVAGYAIGLDMTVRGTEDRSVRKSIDSYSVLGPWMVTADEIADPNALDLSITVNNEPRQKSNTRMLILNVQQCIEFFSSYYTLLPGDVIFSGTPEGVGPVKAGDTMIAEVEKIGRMEVRVRNA
jgi:2,4-didehydro-3-deoxy-L-rhamnonate hydrolase